MECRAKVVYLPDDYIIFARRKIFAGMEKSGKAPRKYIVLTQDELEAVALQAAEIARRKVEEAFRNYPWPERYFTTQQVRELFQVAHQTLWRWEKAGILKPVKIGGLNRYRKSDIDKLTAQ